MMTKATKAQRMRVLMVAGGTLVMLALLYVFLIHQAQLSILEIRQRQSDELAEEHAADRRIRMADAVDQELRRTQRALAEFELTMASGDTYLWMVRTLDQYSKQRPVSFNQVEAPRVEPFEFLPHVPYEAARYTVTGQAAFHEFGSFLAALENAHPLMRLNRLELEPLAFGRPDPEHADLLRFQVELTMPVRRREK